ncbi:MAG: DUF3160 domain-containing protein [Candidatus Nealsonbacteria bacterium]|nr:DUF3160 domain-containing protein [Candidatus Nealsonbacteria bacterium]
MKKNHLVAIIVCVIVAGSGLLVWEMVKAPGSDKVLKEDGLASRPADDTGSVDETTEKNNAIDTAKPPFAAYKAEKTIYVPKLSDYTLALSDISNLSAFEKSAAFTPAQQSALLKNNFFVVANPDKFYSDNENDPVNGFSRVDDWVDLYKNIGGSYFPESRQPENSVFITSDFLLHVYHRLLEKEFENAEQTNFYPILDEISGSLLKSSANSYQKAVDPKQKESFDRLSAYFLVSSAILDNAAGDYNKLKENNFVDDSQNDTKEIILNEVDTLASANNVSEFAKNTAKQEIGLIFDANNVSSSPLLGKYQSELGLYMPEDYTQYSPRSHYAKNAILRDYFRAMMWYGRTNFLLNSPELTQDAANITLLMSAADFKKWESIYLPTAFFVGQTDDLGIYDYKQAMDKTGFDNTNQNSIDKLQQELKNYNDPKIMSSVAIGTQVLGLTKEELQNKTKGFRFMGQRFTPDSFVFSTLTQGDEKPDLKTGQSLPSTPTALMVSTLMGSKVSGSLLDDWIKTSAPRSDKVIADRMATLADYFGKIDLGQWTQNIYWSWLYTLKAVLTDNLDKTGYPMFIKSEDWDKKNLQSFLGSWTELKHDTLLYSKQSYAEMGAGGEEGEPNPIPRGYVEPNVEFLDRLISLANLSNDGLKQFGLLGDTFEQRNGSLSDSLQFYRKIAVAELQNEKISDDDFEKLRLSADSLGQILGPVGGGQLMEKDARSALIADVHTDAAKGQILYEADGIPNYILVAVKDANGTRLAKGLVYSYYEFTNPLGKRLTDADWQQWNYSNISKIPSMAGWNKALIK